MECESFSVHANSVPLVADFAFLVVDREPRVVRDFIDIDRDRHDAVIRAVGDQDVGE